MIEFYAPTFHHLTLIQNVCFPTSLSQCPPPSSSSHPVGKLNSTEQLLGLLCCLWTIIPLLWFFISHICFKVKIVITSASVQNEERLNYPHALKCYQRVKKREEKVIEDMCVEGGGR